MPKQRQDVDRRAFLTGIVTAGAGVATTMDIRQLSSFVTIAERLHFREAARLLSTAQPTLTYQMKSLERDLGVQLFDRSKRNIRLTGAGAVLLVEGKRILAHVEAVQARVLEAARGDHGTRPYVS